MSRILVQKRYRDGLLGTLLLFSALALLFWPDQAAEAMRDGLALCGNVLIPSLFPFFILSSMVIELGMSKYLGCLLEKIMHPLFRVNGSCATALVLGFLGGYPVGARTAIQLYESKQCSKTEAERLLAFCNNCGPAFILGVVGTGIFGSSSLGFLLYLVHILASLIVGIIFRFYKYSDHSIARFCPAPQFQTVHASSALIRCVTGAIQSTLNICSFVLFFSVVIRMMACSGLFSGLSILLGTLFAPLGMDRFWAAHLLAGLLEMTAGVSSLTEGALSGRLSMAAFMLGWAGLSVHCQVLAFIGDTGLSLHTYLIGKLLHGGLSALIISSLSRLFTPNDSISVYLAQQTETLAHMDFQQALRLSIVSAWIMWLSFFLLACFISKKRSGKSPRHAL